MSATERLERLRDFVAAHDRAPSRRTGQQEERSLGDWVARHKNAETPTGDAVRELLDSGTMTAPVNDLDDYQKFCTKHMRAPMPGTNVEREQALTRRPPARWSTSAPTLPDRGRSGVPGRPRTVAPHRFPGGPLLADPECAQHPVRTPSRRRTLAVV